jgi:hypothetical protein
LNAELILSIFFHAFTKTAAPRNAPQAYAQVYAVYLRQAGTAERR